MVYCDKMTSCQYFTALHAVHAHALCFWQGRFFWQTIKSYHTVGTYRFKVELTQMTAAASVELWVSTDSDPHNMSKILDLSYDIQVKV